MAGDGDVVGLALRHAGGNRADADLGHQLHRDQGLRIGVLQIVDQLRQVLDRVGFMAMARVVCASVEIEPSDIAPVEKRLTMAAAGSTSSSGTGLQRSKRKSNRPRKVICRCDWSLMIAAYSLYVA